MRKQVGEQSESVSPNVGINRPDDDTAPRYTVVVGASAGGLDALLGLIRSVERDHLAYVVMQHMDARHDSMLPFLLNKTSKMMVAEAKDGTPISAAMIYVCPPGFEARIECGHLHLTPHSERCALYPIDVLLRSLAVDAGPRAIGIVLSGTGADGTQGLQAVRAAGGITFAQNPGSALFSSMPQSAIEAHAVDFVLDPEDIGITLGQIVDLDACVAPRSPARLMPNVSEAQRARVLQLIAGKFKTDLTSYKSATINRRFERRMHINKLTNVDAYIACLENNAEELECFYHDLLIHVTSFFRDAEVFDALRVQALPELLRGNDVVRVWVPACATGEEAYSLAMCVLEVAEQLQRTIKLHVLATDLDERAIAVARRGIYPFSIALDVSASRLSRFFNRTEEGYQITRDLRDKIVFSRHDILSDAPFRNISLISCRNMLIYMTGSAQNRVLKTCNYALNPEGLLVLGQSEGISDGADLFTPLDRRRRIFKVVKRRGPLNKKHVLDEELRLLAPAAEHMAATDARREEHNPRSLATESAINGIVINHLGHIVDVRGQVQQYLTVRPSLLPSQPLIQEHLQLHLRTAFQEAYAEATATHAPAQREVSPRTAVREALSIKVMPFHLERRNPLHHLVLFHSSPTQTSGLVRQRSAAWASELRPPRFMEPGPNELESKLEVINQYLQRAIEEREAAYEELKVSNEELQSVNEELQSANEELETSREEAQASNEELVTVNDELSRRMVDLDRSRDNLANLLLISDEAIVIVDLGLRIREYTTKAASLLSLTRQDVGRRIECLQHFLDVSAVRSSAQEVMASLQMAERTISVRSTETYTARIYPYKTLDFTIGGVIIKLVSHEQTEQAAATVRGGRQYAERMWQAEKRPVLVLSGALRGLWANHAYFNLMAGEKDDLIGADLRDLNLAPSDVNDFYLCVQGVLQDGIPVRQPVVRITLIKRLIGNALRSHERSCPLGFRSWCCSSSWVIHTGSSNEPYNQTSCRADDEERTD